jgi:hypothetical protein
VCFRAKVVSHFLRTFIYTSQEVFFLSSSFIVLHNILKKKKSTSSHLYFRTGRLNYPKIEKTSIYLPDGSQGLSLYMRTSGHGYTNVLLNDLNWNILVGAAGRM